VASSEEQQLLARARAGDAAAFADLIRPHLATIRRFAYSFSRDWSDADDLAQEALLKAFRSLHTFEGRSALTTWLYTVTRSVCQDSRRARATRASHLHDALEDDVPEEGPLQDHALQRKHEADTLWAAIRRLEPAFRVCIVLFDIEGRSYEEIAEIEGIPIGTVRSRLSRARARLAELLRPERAGRLVCSSIPGTPSLEAPSHDRRRVP